MPHVDSDALALIALGEPVADPADSAHLAGCAACSTTLAELRLVTRLGRDSLARERGEALVAPRPEVWEGIAAELGLGSRAEARGRRRLVPLLAAAAAVVVLAVSGLLGWQLLRPVPPEVLATATLASFPDWPSASGEAAVERMPDGRRVVRLTLSIDDSAAPESLGGYREAWLITRDASALVSLGVVDASTSVLAIPADIDLSRYDLVDVSAESGDGDPAHSGDSIVRGQLVP